MKLIYLIVFGALFLQSLQAQETYNAKYRRSSLYTMLINHPEQKFGTDIEAVFLDMPTPDKFNNHDLNLKTVNSHVLLKIRKSDIKKAENGEGEIEWNLVRNFLDTNAVGRRMVAKWFNRDFETGVCNMDLIAERGYYDASELDVKVAKASARGTALLADAGEELIGNTFIMLNDIRYIDKEKTGNTFREIFKAVGQIAEAVGGDVGNMVASASDLGGKVSDMVAGFRVIVTSYLYQVEWNDAVAEDFYKNYYMDASQGDAEKARTFNENRNLFRLKFVGAQRIATGKTSMNGIKAENDDELKRRMIRKVCTRALDEVIVELQKKHEEFKVKVPILEVEPFITAPIGLKEGITEDSKFEVLEQNLGEDGRTYYKKVGEVRPIKGQIWDNRYMAVEEKAKGAELKETRFKKVSGGTFYKGMLLREVKFTKGNKK